MIDYKSIYLINITGSIEVVPRSLHKGLFIHQLLQKVMNIRGGRLPGFVLLIGTLSNNTNILFIIRIYIIKLNMIMMMCSNMIMMMIIIIKVMKSLMTR